MVKREILLRTIWKRAGLGDTERIRESRQLGPSEYILEVSEGTGESVWIVLVNILWVCFVYFLRYGIIMVEVKSQALKRGVIKIPWIHKMRASLSRAKKMLLKLS